MSAVAKVISKLSHFLVKHSDMEYAGVERGGVGEKMSGPLILSGEFWKRETYLVLDGNRARAFHRLVTELNELWEEYIEKTYERSKCIQGFW